MPHPIDTSSIPEPITDRRQTLRYRQKRKIVRDIWIGVGLLMMASPHVAATLILALGATFLGFAILDETA